MARPLRLEIAGGLYHVTSRGDGQENIFFADADRTAWLRLLAQTCERFNWQVQSWCQMSNHYHLLVETPEANLSVGMRHLNGVYTQYINRMHRRVGHVFQGRYKAVLVERESHLLELARYIVLNPVRARMVECPSEWPWSSHLEMMGMRQPPIWLRCDVLLSMFGRDPCEALAAYEDFVRAGVGLPSVWDGLRAGIYLGSEAFVQSMQRRVAGSTAEAFEIPRLQRRPLARSIADYAAENGRQDAMALAYASGDYTMQQIAHHFGVHYATVSRAVRLRASKGSADLV